MITKVVITKGIYLDKELRLLVSFDEKDKPVDLINIDITKVGQIHEATVEKVLKDIDACIVKFENGEKGFIENRKLKPESFILRHSQNKVVCQSDKFYVQISQDKKGSKPFSCKFLPESKPAIDFIDYYIDNYAMDAQVISDLPEIIEKDINVKAYSDEQMSLWNLYSFTKILDRAASKIVHLKSGGNIIIEPTEAMTIVDVNSSKNYGKTDSLKTNMEALEELSRQLRLRSISGIIIVDLLKVSKEERAELTSAFKGFTAEDMSQVAIHGFTSLGLLEITRTRIISPFII